MTGEGGHEACRPVSDVPGDSGPVGGQGSTDGEQSRAVRGQSKLDKLYSTATGAAVALTPEQTPPRRASVYLPFRRRRRPWLVLTSLVGAVLALLTASLILGAVPLSTDQLGRLLAQSAAIWLDTALAGPRTHEVSGTMQVPGSDSSFDSNFGGQELTPEPAGALPQGSVLDPELEKFSYIVFDIRAPRALAAILAGAALALAGTLMQGLFQNPLAGPEVLGVSSGASLGAVIAVVTGAASSLLILPVAALVGAFCTAALVYVLGVGRHRAALIQILLVGLAVSSLFGGIISAVLLFSQEYQVNQFVFWTLGGLGGRMWQDLGWPALGMVPALVFGLSSGRRLNLFALGEEQAHASGLGVEVHKRLLLGASALLTAMAIALAGPVGFVGLMVPHLCRMVVGPDHRLLLPAATLAGAAFLLASDLLGRTLFPPYEVNVGIITAFLGGPYFIWLVIRRGKEGSL